MEILVAIVGIVGAAAGAAASWCFRTVGRAAVLTGSDDRLRQIVKDQADCIAVLETKVGLLDDSLAQANARIAQLERLLSDRRLVAEVAR